MANTQETTQVIPGGKYLSWAVPNAIEPIDSAVREMVENAISGRRRVDIKEGDTITVQAVDYSHYGEGGWSALEGVVLPRYRVTGTGADVQVSPLSNGMPDFLGDLIPGAKKGDDDGDYVYYTVRLVLERVEHAQDKTEIPGDDSGIKLGRRDTEALESLFSHSSGGGAM